MKHPELSKTNRFYSKAKIKIELPRLQKDGEQEYKPKTLCLVKKNKY